MAESPTAADSTVPQRFVPASALRSAHGVSRGSRAVARLTVRPAACRWGLAFLSTILAVVVVGSPACAYQTAPDAAGDANYSSVIRAIAPSTPGVSARVLGHDNLVRLENRSHLNVVVYGYSGDAYARLLTDGTVQLNIRSPSFYLNEYRFGDQRVPSYADARARPQWRTMDRSFQLAWHDHRIHAGKGDRPSAGARRHTLLYTYRIPLRIGSHPGAISGALYWVGGQDPPSWELFALPALLPFLVLLGVHAARRTRRSDAAPRIAA